MYEIPNIMHTICEDPQKYSEWDNQTCWFLKVMPNIQVSKTKLPRKMKRSIRIFTI